MTRYVPPGSKKTPGPVIKVNYPNRGLASCNGGPQEWMIKND